MDFDQIVSDVFGTADLSTLPPDRIVAGVATLRARFDAEPDPDDRLGLWCLLCMLQAAPDPDKAFDDEDDREAARDFASSMEQDGEE